MSHQPSAGGPGERMAAALSSLAERAQQSNLARAETVASSLDSLARGRLAPAERAAAVRAAHQLAGSAGTFGYRQASALARELERFLIDEDKTAAELRGARRQLAQLRAELRADPELDPGD